MFVYTLDPFPCFFTVGLLLLLTVLTIVFFLSVTVWNLFETNRKCFVSTNTLSLQKRLLRGLVIQTVIPSFVCSPILYIVLSVPQGYYNQALNNSIVIVGSLHGFVSTVVMLSIHQPYRNATLCFLFPCSARNLSDDVGNNKTTKNGKSSGKLNYADYTTSFPNLLPSAAAPYMSANRPQTVQKLQTLNRAQAVG